MDYQTLVLEWLTDPFNPNAVTVCPAAKYKRRTTDLNRRTLKSRPMRQYRGMC